MRHKIPDSKKKKKSSITIDSDLLDIFDKHIENQNITNVSKYIENLIRKDMENKGKDIKREF